MFSWQLNGKNLAGENNIAQDLGIVDESSLKLVEQAPAGDPVAVPPEEDLDQAALDVRSCVTICFSINELTMYEEPLVQLTKKSICVHISL